MRFSGRSLIDECPLFLLNVMLSICKHRIVFDIMHLTVYFVVVPSLWTCKIKKKMCTKFRHVCPSKRRTTRQLGNTCTSQAVMCAPSPIDLVKQPFHEADSKNQYIDVFCACAVTWGSQLPWTALFCQCWRTLPAEWSLFACGTL